MFEIIRANRQKSAGLILLLGGIFIAFGYAVGMMLAPDTPNVSLMFVGVGVTIWLVMLLTSVIGGEKILLKSATARQVSAEDQPQLMNVVEEMCIASGLTPVPRVYVIELSDPNAFAVGLKPERAAVAVTTGLMERLQRDELQGVIAHEIAHIKNRDTLFMTLAGVTVGAIVMLGDVFWRAMFWGSMSGGRRRSGGGGQGKGNAMLMVAAVVLAILAPIMARLLYLACSRRREYLADACAAQYTRYPEGLAGALEKISGQVAATTRQQRKETNHVLAPMYIVNPLAARAKHSGWFSTHPPTEDRVKVLRGMDGSSSFTAYEQAYRALHPKHTVLVPSMLLSESDDTGAAAVSAKRRAHE